MTSARNSTIRARDLRPEVTLLLAVAVPRWGPGSTSAVLDLMAAGTPLDWAYFLDQSLRQQVMPMVGRNLTRYLPKDRFLVPHLWIYSAAYEANTRRNRGLSTEFGRVFRELNERGVRFAVRKGPSLWLSVYDDPGIRRMNDLDLLIERDSLDMAVEVLADLGYAQGSVSATGGRIVAHERKTRLFWALHLNNALPFKKLTSDPDVVKFEIDLCLELFQKRSTGSVDTRAVLSRAVPAEICGEPAMRLSPLDQLLDICLHLYKEATSYYSIARGKDIHLLRFMDVAESVRVTPPGTLAELPRYVAEVGARREVYFAMYHASLLYPDHIPAELLDQIVPPELDYLDEYGELEGRTTRWRQDFVDRLFNPDRRLELPGPSSIPVP
jgi:Uncharacterised nucleotidyltransferase